MPTLPQAISDLFKTKQAKKLNTSCVSERSTMMYKAVLNFRRIVSPLYDKIRRCYENSHCAKSYLI